MSKTRNKTRSPHFASHTRCTKCDCPILIVEDQLSIASMLASVIHERYGYDTVIAGSLEQTAQVITEQPIHLAIADLNLPDAPYGEVIDLLSKHRISTIALTGAFGREMRETILKKGAIDYIPKQSPHSIEYAIEMANRIYMNHHTEVLVVDDSLSSRALLKHILEMQQFQVIVASNAEEALSILTEKPDIRLALIDYEMPGMNGFELIHEVRKQCSKEELAIIGISASEEGEMSAQFLKSGANDFIRKPFSYEEILCRISQNLEMLELIRSNREAAYLDFLTGLHNRRHFFEEGAKLHKQIRQSGKTVAAMLDVDHFKKINDNYGHDCGDVVLKKLAKLLKRHFDQHLLARLGGEEFSIILKDTTSEEASALLDAFRQEVENSPVECGAETIHYTVSIGLTDQPGKSVDDFVKTADQYLYQAKAGGRNRVVGESTSTPP